MKQATFAAGCFWGVEAIYKKLPGIVETAVGYMGGDTENPSYQDVCTGTTGHAEVLQLTYDETKVVYSDLLEIFWNNHNPSSLNKQGPDVGTQYRSAIFYHDEEQKLQAEQDIKQLDASGKYQNKIVTQLVPAKTFYRAEEYHQNYLEKNGLPLCHL